MSNLPAETYPQTSASPAVWRPWQARAPLRARLGPFPLLLPGLILIVALFLGPLAYMGYLSVTDPSVGLANYGHIVGKSVYLKVVWFTIQTALFVTLLALLLGYPVAYQLSSIRERWANLLLIAVVLPYFVSFLIRTYSWMTILGRQGVVNQFLLDTGLVERPAKLLFNTFSVYVGMVHVMTPIMILVLYGVMRGIDRSLIQAARSLGASPLQAFARVFLPLSMPGIGSGCLLVFILSLGFYITPALLGSGREVMAAGLIYDQIAELRNWGFGAAVSIVLLALVGLTYVVLSPVAGFEQAVTGTLGGSEVLGQAKSRTSQRLRGGYAWLSGMASRLLEPLFVGLDRIDALFSNRRARSTWSLGMVVRWLFVAAVLIYLIAPILIVIPLSFSAANYLEFPPTELSLRWYQHFFDQPSWVRATLFSLRVGVLATVLALLLGLTATIALVRFRPRGGRLIFVLFLLPIVIPEIITAVGIYFVFAPLKLTNSLLGFVLAHSLLAVPYVVVVVAPALHGLDVRFEQAARSLGASPLATFRLITFPLIRPSIIAAALFGFLASFDSLLLALFLAGSSTATLPIKMWDEIRLEITPVIAAVSTMEIALTAVVIVVLSQLQRRQGRSPLVGVPQ